MNRGLRPPFQMAERYTVKHGGSVIVCGGAPCVFEDFEKAKELRPDADVVGANFAVKLFPEIVHVWTQHNDVGKELKDSVDRTIFVHARPAKIRSGTGGNMWLLPVPAHKWAYIDYEWPEFGWFNGSSGVAAGLWAKHGLGYDEVILCGCPVSKDTNKYHEAYEEGTRHKKGADWAKKSSFAHWQQSILKHKENGKTQGIYSMSGFTKGVLGEPPVMEN